MEESATPTPRPAAVFPPLRNWFLTERVPPRAGRVPMRKRPVDEIRRQAAGGPGAASDSTLRAPPPHTSHHIHQYLRLVAALGAIAEPMPPYLEVTREEIVAVQQRFSLAGDVPWSGLNPGAEYGPAKRWPPDRFIAAATQTQKTTNCRWLIFGGPSDVQLATELSESLTRDFPSAPPLNLAGKTSLRELCALLKICRVLLTNDTGPMHVAAAVGTPVVAVFGSTSPELTGPGLPVVSTNHLLHSNAACSPCFRRRCPIDFRCMTGISVARVVEAVLTALNSCHEK